MMMQRTANEYAACERRICKRPDQPKINRITNNDAVSALHHCLLNRLRAHEGERNNWFSKIQLLGQKNIETKHLSIVKARLLFTLSRRFSLLVGYNK